MKTKKSYKHPAPANVMIDLETLGTAADAAIIAIGACEFNPLNGDIGRTFYERITWDTAMEGRSVTADTVKWWVRQGEAARSEVLDSETTFEQALKDFRAWLPNGCNVWGNGATFDITILTTAYNNQPPWHFRFVRDMRTIVALDAARFDEIEPKEIAHCALHDAVWQAKYVALAFSRLWYGVH